jgi:hypothetical protein
VPDPRDDPRALEIDEHREVVRGVGAGEDPRHPHLQRVDPREIEDALRGGEQRVPGPEPQAFRHRGAEHAVAEHGERSAPCHLEAAEVEVVERRADDGEASRAKPHVHGYGEREV